MNSYHSNRRKISFFFWFSRLPFFPLSAPHKYAHTRFTSAYHIGRDGDIIVGINIGSLFGFNDDGFDGGFDERRAKKGSEKSLDGLDESDSSVVVDLCD